MKRLALIVALVTSGGPAHAGGLARPNPISARGVSLGGAFVAVADDPTALHFNPAGLSLLKSSNLLLGAELVYAPRTYTPNLPDETCMSEPEICEAQSPNTSVIPLPVIGWVGKLSREGVPSRFAFGIGLWNTYGGQLAYDAFTNPAVPQLVETQNAVIEIVPGVAYEVNDVLAVGASVRVGIGLFHVKTIARPSNADLDASGLGVGGNLGLMIRPSSTFRIGVAYHTTLTNKLSGDGTIITNEERAVTIELEQVWPQSAAMGCAWDVSDALTLSAELDWTDWSRLNTLDIKFTDDPGLNQTLRLDWNDNYSFRMGGQLTATDSLAIRAGVYFDTVAVPDSTTERQFLDSDKAGVAAGVSYAFSPSWRLDMALDALLPLGARVIEDNSDTHGQWAYPIRTTPETAANAAPGEHEGRLVSVELAVQYLY